ncbi:MAG: site-specific DNA-methyltransferase [Pseudomonadota bacterium]
MRCLTAGVSAALRPTPSSEVWVGDCAALLSHIPAGSVDLLFADPPYNLQLNGDLFRPNQTRVDGVDAAWDQFCDLTAYDAFTRAWLEPARRALKPNGTLWVIGSYHNIFRVGAAVQDLGFWILNDVVWIKTNPMPNFRGRRLTNAHETLIWAVADRRRTDYTFNYRSLKTFNDDLQLRSDWIFPVCGGPERMRGPDGAKLHPTQKPQGLLTRILLGASKPGDLVVDPFLGSGTTGAIAARLGRRFIGIEHDETYAALASERIAAVEPLADTELAQDGFQPKPPKIPFGFLLEAGLVQPGDTLVAGEHRADVRIDGSIRSGPHEGSIHRVGAAVRDTQSCNGWTFWALERDGEPVPLDDLRAAVRAGLATAG